MARDGALHSAGAAPRPRVLVTGMGALSAAGEGVAALRAALRGTTTCLSEVSLFDTSDLRVHIAGEVRHIPATGLLPRSARVRASRSDRMALAAVAEALADADLALDAVDPQRLAVAVGSSTGGMFETESYYATRVRHTAAGRHRAHLAAATVGAPADLIASALGACGPRLAPSTACSSSAIALALGAAWIRSGAADVVVAGGTDGLARMTYSGFHALQALSPEPCRPFDAERRGLSLGEGAAILILESEAHAAARGALPRGEIAGAGLSCDASHPTAPHAESRGAALALERALADAGVRPEHVDYVNAHGTGTPQNDVCEATALKLVLGEWAERVPISSTKALLGHLLGAAGAIEAVVALIAVADGLVPPTVNLRTIDPACGLDFVPGAPRQRRIELAVSNSYGFGGNNCSLVLRRGHAHA